METATTALATRIATQATQALSDAKRPKSEIGVPAMAAEVDLQGTPKGFVPFMVGKLGNFPFEWQNPMNLQFTTDAYRWIASSISLVNGIAQQGEPFTNFYITAMRQVQFSQSVADQRKLADSAKDLQTAQSALLRAWQAAFGSLPTGGAPINKVIDDIASNWAEPSTTFQTLLKAPVLTRLLNKIPPAGGAVLPVLSNYLDAWTSNDALVDLGPSKRGLAKAALNGALYPDASNGAVQLDDGSWRPAFDFASSPDQIRNNIENGTGEAAYLLDVELEPTPSNGAALSMGIHGTPAEVDPNLFSLIADGRDLVSAVFAVDKTAISAEIDFKDLTIVHFGPRDFNIQTYSGWLWPTPLRDALANSGQGDVTGYTFGSQNDLEFLTDGRFGFLTGVAISHHPSIRLRQVSSDFQTIASSFANLGTVEVSVSGQNFQATASVKVDASTNSFTLELTPQGTMTLGNGRAFVHAVQPFFPLAKAQV